jgi:hypothetical protein
VRKKTWAERQAEADPAQFEYELLEAIDEERIAVADHEAQAGWHRRMLAELKKLADERGIVYAPEPDHLSFATRTESMLTHHDAAARVASFMKASSKTQAEFAVEAHIGERTLRRLLKTHTASRQTWAEVANALKTTPDELLK